MTASLELSIVMPVYNEAAAIRDVLLEWIAEVEPLGVEYELVVLDDGSRDGTHDALQAMAADHRALRVLRHANRGHGPTILRGYEEARGAWVLQIDSDGEIPAHGFADVWRERERYDLVIGRRTDRTSTAIRRLVSAASRASVRVLFGRGIDDVNVPYRLFRASSLRELTAQLPGDLFAPNVILSGLAVRHGLRIRQVPVVHVPRRQGASSLDRFKVLRPAARSLRQTIAAAWRARRRG